MMTKGFKDEKGKFRPTENNSIGIRSGSMKMSNLRHIKPSRFARKEPRKREIDVWSFDEAPQDLKEKILAKIHNLFRRSFLAIV